MLHAKSYPGDDPWGFVGFELRSTALAFIFAVLSWPCVALSLDYADYGGSSGPTPIPMDDPGRWAAALGAVLAASVVAGAVCAPVVMFDRFGGWFATVTLAWIVALIALPILPGVLHVNVGHDPGFVGYVFFGREAPLIRVNDPWSGLQNLALVWAGPLAAPAPFGALAIGSLLWAWIVRRDRYQL